MRLCCTWWLLALIGGWPALAGTQLQLLPTPEQQRVFGGPGRNISLIFSNAADQDFDAAIQVRMFQTSSGTAAPFGEWPWKMLRVQPRQTVLESDQLDFPAVNAETKFLVQWVANSNHIIGTTEIWVYPTNLLAELKPMAASDGPGLFDPENQLKPLLKNLNVSFTDLQNYGLAYFSGKLAIIGPFASRAQMRPELPDQIKALAKRSVAVVWLLPPAEKRDKLEPLYQPEPSFYSITENTNAVVVVQADMVSRLPDNPQAQLNLIYFCKLALNPAPPALPVFAYQP
jgi:hypothetical protein